MLLLPLLAFFVFKRRGKLRFPTLKILTGAGVRSKWFSGHLLTVLRLAALGFVIIALARPLGENPKPGYVAGAYKPSRRAANYFKAYRL